MSAFMAWSRFGAWVGRVRRETAVLAVVAFLGGFAWSPSAQAQALVCEPPGDLRCWYLVGGTGEAPNRVSFISRLVDEALVDGRRRIEYIQVVEPAGHPEAFVVWDMEVDCKKSSFRISRTRAGLRDGRVMEKPVENSDWRGFAGSRYGEAFAEPFACHARPHLNRNVILLWTAYRAPDVVRLFRTTFWEGEPAESGPLR